MTTRRFHGTVLLVAILGSLLATGCSRPASDSASTQGRTSTATAPADTLPGPGRLVFEDDFSGETIGESWQTASDRWQLQEGVLRVSGARNEGLWLQVALPDEVRIDVDLTSHGEEGDLKFEVFTDGRTHESGYVGIFGGWNNRLNLIARLDEHGEDRHVGQPGVQVEPERRYRFSIVRTDNRLRWFVDGEHFLTFDDSEPLRGPEHAYFGLNNWNVPQSIHRVAVYDLSSGE